MIWMGPNVCGQRITPVVINFSGDSYVGSFSVVSMSLGEVAVTTLVGGSGVVTQGFLQPEVDVPCRDFQLDYYPNPVTDNLTLRDTECNQLIRYIEVIDMQGRLVERLVLQNRQADLAVIMNGVYLVKAFGYSENLVGTFRIAKVRK